MISVRNPKTGKYILPNGVTYKRLVKEGVLQPEDTSNKIENFTYVYDEDIWIRKHSTKYNELLSKGLVYDKDTNSIIKEHLHSGVNSKNPLWNTDTLSVILKIACKDDIVTYRNCIRVSKRFKRATERSVLVSDAVRFYCSRTKDVYIKEFKHIPILVVINYAWQYPERFVYHLDIEGTAKHFKMLLQNPSYAERLLECTLPWLEACAVGAPVAKCLEWTKLKPILAVLDIPDDKKQLVIRVRCNCLHDSTMTLGECIIKARL